MTHADTRSSAMLSCVARRLRLPDDIAQAIAAFVSLPPALRADAARAIMELHAHAHQGDATEPVAYDPDRALDVLLRKAREGGLRQESMNNRQNRLT